LKRENAILQSEEVVDPILKADDPVTAVQQETIQFVDAGLPESDIRVTEFEPTYGEHTDEMASLGKFLERPVLIDQFTWLESDTFSLSPRTLYPWQAYFSNTYIASKLANFSRVHCNLHPEFRFNASPFYYGAMRVCYDPLNSGKFAPLTTEDVIPLSQTPGVMLEPQVTSVAEMELPFLWPHSWLNTALVSQFQQMGKLYFSVFSQLQSANGVTGTGITVSVYARACNIEISGPTVKAILQSGVISGPAAAIAGFAQKFANAGSIGPYARAVDIGATAVSRIAKIFGFSNAPVTSNVNPVQNKVYHAFANTETRMPIDKLAIDPANEVTIDNRVTGDVGDDPLIIQTLAMKKSLVKIVAWNSSIPANTIIQHGTVSPSILRTAAGTSQTLHYYTPSGWLAACFRFWRGGMRYTFRVERSMYHKGRLIVCWDPNGTLTALGVETAVFSKIFDLSSPDQEFTFDIPYKAISPWLKTTVTSALQSTAPTVDYSAFNGHFVLGVLNPLTGPTASSTVDILISAQTLEDMEFAAPTTLPLNTTVAAIQSGVVNENVVDGSSVKFSERIPDITVGERIGSLRTILHRTTRALTQYVGLNQGDCSGVTTPWCFHTINCFDRLPPVYGFQTSNSYNWATSVIATGAKPINYATNHPINWVLAAFAGYRGSVVVHANVSTNGWISDMSSMSLTRIDHNFCGLNTPNNVVRNTAFNYYGTNAGASLISLQVSTKTNGATQIPMWPAGHGGMTVTNGKTQMAVSAVIPQYARTRFMPAAFSQRNSDFIDTVYDGTRFDADFSVLETGAAGSVVWPRVDVYWAAGVDFNPVFFTGVPRMYNYTPPTPLSVNV